MVNDTPDNPQDQIDIGLTTLREQKRRRREMWLAGIAGLVIVLSTVLEYKYLGGDSYLFLGLFNLNFILILLVLFLVGRNIIKLVLERRRKVLGSKLRTRLVLIFVGLTLLPTVLLFISSMKFIQISFDYWFKSQVSNAMERTLDMGQGFYAQSQDRLEHMATMILDQADGAGLSWGGRGMDQLLERKRREYDLSLLGVLTPDKTERNWHSSESFIKDWTEIKSDINWHILGSNDAFWSMPLTDPAGDALLGIMPVDGGKKGYLILAEDLGQGFMFRLDQIVRDVREYNQMKIFKKTIKGTLYFPLIVTYLLILLGATWFGFRLAKEISAPIQALTAATKRIAKGDLSVRLKDESSDEMGNLIGFFNTMAEDLQTSRTHITEANQELAGKNVELEQRRRYIETILENIAAGVVSWDNDGDISTINKAAVEMLGLPRSVLTHKRHLPAEDRGRLNRLFEQASRRKWDEPAEPWSQLLDWPGQERKIMANVVPLGTEVEEGNGFVAVLEDITELEKAQRLEAWREVAKRIAHEIKNPLTPIKLSAQRLERKYAGEVADPVFNQCTELIVRQVEYLQQMVTEFSGFAKLPEVVLKPDDLSSLLVEVVDLFRNTRRDIEWTLSGQDHLTIMAFDRAAMRQALVNILTNAAEALDGQPNGRVDVTVVSGGRREWLRMEIKDNGRGLSLEERSRLFEPYFSRKKGGTGLGLTIVKSIITDHHGYVRALPAPEQGTVITVELPVSA